MSAICSWSFAVRPPPRPPPTLLPSVPRGFRAHLPLHTCVSVLFLFFSLCVRPPHISQEDGPILKDTGRAAAPCQGWFSAPATSLL